MTTSHIAVLLGGVTSAPDRLSASLLRLLPILTERALVGARLGYDSRHGHVLAELRFATAPRVARIRQRLAFWCSRTGGWARSVEGMSPDQLRGFRETFSGCQVVNENPPVDRWAPALRALVAAAGVELPLGGAPELRLVVGGTRGDGLAFDATLRRLEIPGALAPPIGDGLVLAVEPAGAPRARRHALATVTSIRPPTRGVPGAGATFTVDLHPGAVGACELLWTTCGRSRPWPFGVGPRLRAAGAPAPEVRTPRRRALIVDDDALVRCVLGDVLRARGFDVLEAPDGATALRVISDELLSLDAVVTDLQMPGLTGEALLAAVRGAGGEADLVLVMMGASLDRALQARLEGAGADAALPKTQGAEAVASAVEAALVRRVGPGTTPRTRA